MTATSALEKIESLIDVATQRLVPQALQRLSVKEILGEHVIRKAAALTIPTKEELGVTTETEAAYNRLVKYLRLHEPTGHEKDVAHKHNVVRFLNLKQMLYECQQAKLPQIQVACLKMVVEWFDESASRFDSNCTVNGSASTPVLPPRMSPKKPSALNTSADPRMTKSTSEEVLTTGSLGVTMKGAIAEKLKKYRMPNLRASHIRRITQLRSRGVDAPEEDLEINDGEAPQDDSGRGDEILDPADYEKRDRNERIKATFKTYVPETDAEFTMNQVWLERKHEEDVENDKAKEVRGKLLTWSMNKSRDESEYLRKREAMQLAAGLDRLIESHIEAINQPHRRHIEKKKQEWQAIQQAVPPSALSKADQHQTEANDQDDECSTPSRTSGHMLNTVKKKKSSTGTPIGSGGMHFRNQLPANYTPQSKRSSGTPTSFSSKDCGSTPNTPLSSSSSGKLILLDEAAARAEGRALSRRISSESPVGSGESPAVHDDDDERVEGSFQSTLKFSERVQEHPRELKFQPFHTSSLSHGSLPFSRAVSASALSRKLYPRGTLPPQPEPIDPEYKYLHAAAVNRKPPVPANILPDKPLPGQSKNSVGPKSTSATNNQLESTRATGAPGGSKLPPNMPPSTTLLNSNSGQFVSDFRVEQMREVDRIRLLFEQHKLNIPTSVIEGGLLVPEDRSTLECARNLPLPGSRLISNPLLQVRVKTKATKKKKKKKGGKAGAKKTKGKNSAGDRSKSPMKRKKK